MKTEDFKVLLRCLNDHQVKYLIIGGYAMRIYAKARPAKDLDIWLQPDRENGAALIAALRAFGTPVDGWKPEDFTQEGFFYRKGDPPNRVELLMTVTAMKFDEAWPNRVVADFDGVPAYYGSKEDIIRMKTAFGRPEDLEDLRNLRDQTSPGNFNLFVSPNS